MSTVERVAWVVQFVLVCGLTLAVAVEFYRQRRPRRPRGPKV